jgi:RimJ/RimL family protein N-acetyltransferase
MLSSFPLPSEVQTPRLLLRRQHPDDAARIKDAVDASLDHLKASVAWAQTAPFPLAVLANRLAQSSVAFDAGEEWVFTILDLGGNRVLGAAALAPGERALRALLGPEIVEAGYWLRADATGNGYATEATAALVELAFSRLGARRVAICHDPDNAASAGVPLRLGFRDYGTVTAEKLPDRQAADGSARRATKIWVHDAPPPGQHRRPGPTSPA